jgi:hypothetical protein
MEDELYAGQCVPRTYSSETGLIPMFIFGHPEVYICAPLCILFKNSLESRLLTNLRVSTFSSY